MVSDNSQDLLWTLSGNNGNTWFQGITPFKSDVKHQIMFEGIRGNSDLGDIVISFC